MYASNLKEKMKNPRGRIEVKKFIKGPLFIPVLSGHYSRGYERRFQAERVLKQWLRIDLRKERRDAR